MRVLRAWLGRLSTLALVGLPAPAAAQLAGQEFQVNTYTTDSQQYPDVASDASGNFVIVWQSWVQDGSSQGVFGQRFDSTGQALGSEFRINSHTAGSQDHAVVASDASGNFVVVWDGAGQGDTSGIFGQRYDNDGNPLGGAFRVNSYVTSVQFDASVASDASGNFVVVWSSFGQDGSDDGVFGQRYDSAGRRLGSEFRVNTSTARDQYQASVASDASGNFVVVWEDYDYLGNADIFGQRYDSSGGTLGSEFRVNSHTPNRQVQPSVASDASGNFVVVWQDYDQQDGSLSGILGQRYDSMGNALGSEFQVNSYTSQSQVHPSVACDASGNFVVLWDSDSQDGSDDAIFGRRFDSAGDPNGFDFRVNSYTVGRQQIPAVAVTGADRFVAAWRSDDQDGSEPGVFGQRFDFSGPAPMVLHVGDLDGKAKNVGADWRAQVKITVHDDSHNPVGGALVLFRISALMGNLLRCTTTAGGQCEVSVVVSDSVAELRFMVKDVNKVGIGYADGLNHDPDPDSDGTVILVSQP